MATKAEMIHWLTTNEPDVSKYQKIEAAHDDRILRLYIEYHGRADTWETLATSEKQKVLDAIVAIGIARAGMPILANTFNLSSMKGGWMYTNIFHQEKSARLGISAGGVISFNGSPVHFLGGLNNLLQQLTARA